MAMPVTRGTIVRVVLVGLAALAAASHLMASAAFTVNPMMIRLTARSTSQLLTISNQARQPIRFEIKAFKWDHDESDAMQLEPAADVVFFPNVVTIPAGGQQRVRVGTTAVAGDTERSYRIFVEELPGAPAAGAAAAQVAMRTRIGIPVFLAAVKPEARAEFQGLGVQDGQLAVRLRNSGNTHLVVDHVELRGLGDASQVAFVRTIPGWYVLPGRARRFETALSPDECRAAKTLTARAVTDGGTVDARATVSASACGGGR